MNVRLTGAVVVALGAALGVMPFLGWYRADLPGRDVRFTGVEVAGELWSLPVLAGAVVVAGAVLAVAGPAPRSPLGRWMGGIVAVAGVLALAWALKGVLDVRAVAVPAPSPGGPEAPLEAQPVGFIAAAASAAAVCAALLWLRAGSLGSAPS